MTSKTVNPALPQPGDRFDSDWGRYEVVNQLPDGRFVLMDLARASAFVMPTLERLRADYTPVDRPVPRPPPAKPQPPTTAVAAPAAPSAEPPSTWTPPAPRVAHADSCLGAVRPPDGAVFVAALTTLPHLETRYWLPCLTRAEGSDPHAYFITSNTDPHLLCPACRKAAGLPSSRPAAAPPPPAAAPPPPAAAPLPPAADPAACSKCGALRTVMFEMAPDARGLAWRLCHPCWSNIG